MNGILLLAVGAVWMEVNLSSRNKAIAYWTLLYGAYANWAVTTLAAIFGTTAMSPFTGARQAARAWQEGLVTAGFASVGIAIIMAALLLLWGYASYHPSINESTPSVECMPWPATFSYPHRRGRCREPDKRQK